MTDLDKPPPWSKTHMNYADWAEQMIEWQEQAIEQLRAANAALKGESKELAALVVDLMAERDEARELVDYAIDLTDGLCRERLLSGKISWE